MLDPSNLLNSEKGIFSFQDAGSAQTAPSSRAKTTSDAKKSSPKGDGTPPPKPAVAPQGGKTLRSRLLLTLLPTTLLPLLVASFIGTSITYERAKEERLTNIEKNALLTSEITDEFFADVVKVSRLLEANPSAIRALKSSSQQVQSQGLLQKPIEQIEKEFASTKLLAPNPDLNQYLQAMTQEQDIAEAIVTDNNGFNVGYSSMTSDFVQSDEEWWQIGYREGEKLLEPNFDESTQAAVVELVKSLKDPSSGEVLGVVKMGVSAAKLIDTLAASVGVEMSGSEQVQIVYGKSGEVLNSVSAQESIQLGEITGGEPVIRAAQIFHRYLAEGNSQDALGNLQQINGLANVSLTESEARADRDILAFETEKKYFKVTEIPNTGLLAIVSVDKQEVARAANDLRAVFALSAVILGAAAAAAIALIARNISQPLTSLSQKVQQVAAGDLKVQAEVGGTRETRSLADNFNYLVKQINSLLGERALAEAQRQQKESLEREIDGLINELEGALEGDLTVRASLNSIEMSTVADLFNSIIDNLKDIAVQVKQSSTQVSSSLAENERSIQLLARQAIQEAEETRKTLGSVEQMSRSIEEVAANANQAAALADGAYHETEQGAIAMDETVNSIVSLRTTVGETAKKMKRLGESSQKISQVVSLIEEIALKTNLLAINASVEASRAGEQGQGFTVVAEQVGALAEQSAAATKEIAQIVAAIQAETQEVAEAMELGTAQVVESTRLVESTKQRLERVLERSQNINELMQSISQSTISQTDTSHIVTKLMQQIAQYSEERLASSEQVAHSMQATAQVARKLESAVEQFKVNEE